MKKFLALLLSLVMVLALVACGAFIKLDVIWVLADIVNGLMAIPNLIALIALSGVIVAETKKYLDARAQGEGREQERFHVIFRLPFENDSIKKALAGPACEGFSYMDFMIWGFIKG